VTGYPTLKVFRNGSPTDYSGPRKADGIISYMIKQSLPAVTTVTKESHDQFIKDDKVVLVAYGDASHPIPQSYLDYANVARDSFLFGKYESADLPSIPESPSLPAVVLYKSFDEGYAVLPASEIASSTPESLAEFVKVNSVPLLDEISPENFGTYAEQGLPIAYLFVDPEDLSTLEKLVEELTPVAKEHKGAVNFVYIDAVKFVDHGKSLNLPGDEWPAFVVQDLAGQTKFPMPSREKSPRASSRLRSRRLRTVRSTSSSRTAGTRSSTTRRRTCLPSSTPPGAVTAVSTTLRVETALGVRVHHKLDPELTPCQSALPRLGTRLVRSTPTATLSCECSVPS
jgi:hypothetical protein